MSKRHTHVIKCPHGKGRRTAARWAMIGAVVGLALVIFSGGDADASTRAAGPDLTPGFDVCEASAPVAQPPDSDLPGIFLERPENVVATGNPTEPADINRLLSTSGMGGMRPIVYLDGCAADPTKTADRVAAWSDSTIGGWFTTWGQSFTAMADSVDRRVWSPTWIPTLIGNLAENTVGRLEAAILLPFLGLGLMIATILGWKDARKGDTSAAASMAGWAVLAVVLGALIILKPTTMASGTQAVASTVSQGLHGTTGNAGTSTTESIMRDVHYQGWQRRTFGTSESETAKRYGPALLATTRITWEEWDRVNPARARDDAERERILKDREELLEAKANAFKEIAEKIEKEDPDAYEWLTGRHGSFSVAMYEWAFALAASGFRLAIDLMLVLAFLLLAVYGFVWLAALPYIVTPRGESLGRGLFDSTAGVVGFIAIGVVGLWMFTVYAGVVMMPGTSSFWSFTLLGLGTFGFWTLLRPDRKILHLLTAGRVRSNGKTTRKMIRMVALYSGAKWAHDQAHDRMESAGTRVRGAPAAFRDGLRAEWNEGRQRPDYDGHPTVYEPAAPVDPPPMPAPRTAGEATPARPASEHLYDPAPPWGTPEAHPTPPPPGTVGEADYYQPPAPAEARPQQRERNR